jgi:hypothetical protein
MARKFLALAMVFVFGLSLAGCATEGGYYSPGRSAGAGALGGAATGAALGSIIGAAPGPAPTGAWVGAAAGGVLGAVGGYLYAEHRNSQMASAQAAAQSYNYAPSQGSVVNVDSAYANPSTVSPGQQVNLGMTYTILTPNNVPVSATMMREVRYGGATLGQPYQTQISNTNGTYTDTVAYALPSNASPGSYTVTNRIITNYGTSQRDSYFTVQ